MENRMTRERKDAIYWLNNLIGRYGSMYDAALEMAIDVLTKQDIINIDDDIIIRQQAIDALQKCRKHCIDPFDSYHIDIQDAEYQLWKLPTVQHGQQWIPVSELLPEEDGFYLVTVNYGGAAWVHESYFIQCNSRGVHWDYSDVTAWMPMPEHYKGE